MTGTLSQGLLIGLCGAVTHPTYGTFEVFGRRMGSVDLRDLRAYVGHVNPRHPPRSALAGRPPARARAPYGRALDGAGADGALMRERGPAHIACAGPLRAVGTAYLFRLAQNSSNESRLSASVSFAPMTASATVSVT